MVQLKPFWRFYGAKWRAAPRYPKPRHDEIIEPFAGAAGYSTRYYDRCVTLVDIDPVIAAVWSFLVTSNGNDICNIPLVESVSDLPPGLHQGAYYLVGFWMNSACTTPRKTLSGGWKKLRESGRKYVGWSQPVRDRIASQVEHVQHWKIVRGDYTTVDNRVATWFVDPPYSCSAGRHYRFNKVNYPDLSNWCRSRSGQVIVCEAAGASWLPFSPLHNAKAGPRTQESAEAIWTW